MSRPPVFRLAALGAMVVLVIAGVLATRLVNSVQDAIAAEVGLRGVREVTVLQTQQWGDQAVALYRGRNGAMTELGVASLSRSVGRWAAETANDVITREPMPGPVEISCGSGGSKGFQYTAVYGLALSPAVRSVSARMGGQTLQATLGTGGSFLLAVPRLVTVRNLAVRDQRGRVLWRASTSCVAKRPANGGDSHR